AARKTRSAKLQAADLLLRRLETGIGTGEVGVEEIEGAMFREHTVARDRWAASLARAVTARVGADDLQDELRWMFRDAVDDY
ncbi:hypothetical protein NL310_29100, partial [Klebsiella pneumoniae]|nr:hypothetical protein [Klebsiella pneumoniae]